MEHDADRRARYFRTECRECGVVNVLGRACWVRRCEDTDEYTVAYACPVCRRRAVAACERGTVVLLVSSGARLTSWRYPDELADPVRTDHSVEAEHAMLEMIVDRGWLDVLEWL